MIKIRWHRFKKKHRSDARSYIIALLFPKLFSTETLKSYGSKEIGSVRNQDATNCEENAALWKQGMWYTCNAHCICELYADNCEENRRDCVRLTCKMILTKIKMWTIASTHFYFWYLYWNNFILSIESNLFIITFTFPHSCVGFYMNILVFKTRTF